MPIYRIVFVPSAQKQLAALDPTVRRRVAAAIDGLARDPRPPGAIKMRGGEGYRLRVGDWRVIYDIHDDEVLVLVLRVKHRREAYR